MLWTRRLAEAIARSPIGQNEGCAYLHLVARPGVPEEDMLDRAMGDQDVATFLNGLFSTALSEDVWPRTSGGKGYSPDLADNNSFKRRADGWVTAQGLGADWRDFEEPRLVLDFEISPDGSGRLFCGRAAERVQSDEFWLFEDLVAGLTARFLSVLGGLYAAGAYLGPVDTGLAVTGLRGAVSSNLSSHILSRHFLQPYERDEYRRTGQFPAAALNDDPRAAARKLVLPLTWAITGERYDPFSD